MDLQIPREFDGPVASLSRPTDHARRAVRAAELLLGAFAVVVAVPVGVAAALTQPAGAEHPHLAGVAAATATLLVCWVLLGLGSAWWNRRLAVLDRQQWTAGWARVEPTWSGRHSP